MCGLLGVTPRSYSGSRCVPFRGAGGGSKQATLLVGLGVPQCLPVLAPSLARRLLIGDARLLHRTPCLYHDLLGGRREQPHVNYQAALSTPTCQLVQGRPASSAHQDVT